MTIDAANETSVSSIASSAPLQNGPEESASQKRWVLNPPSSYFTSPVGMLYFFARLVIVPFALSALIPVATFAPMPSPRR
jgi:hypothetical protein